MKVVKLLDRVQAVLHLYINLMLPAIQEYNLKSELACNNCCQISLHFNINEFMKSVTIEPLTCKTYNYL